MSETKSIEDAILDYLATEMDICCATSGDIAVASSWVDRLDSILERVAGMRRNALDRLGDAIRNSGTAS